MDLCTKIEAYERLVEKRKRFRFSDDNLVNPSETLFDVNEIEPWAQWQNNLDADILLIGQDFCDVKTYERTQGKVERFPQKYEFQSNQNLHGFFQYLGFDLGHPMTPNKQHPIFFTNAVMALKKPPMSKNFSDKWLAESRTEFLIPLIDIIKPKIIVTLGAKALKSVAAIYSLPTPSLSIAVDQPPIQRDDVYIFPVVHTGGLGHSTRSRVQQSTDWRKLAMQIIPILDQPK